MMRELTNCKSVEGRSRQKNNRRSNMQVAVVFIVRKIAIKELLVGIHE